jgi:Cdc6-like AAA superfamily ATPase
MAEEKSLSYQINAAFLGVQRRAEAVDRQTLVQTFVDIGALFAVLSSHDHQIVYGRRGTGKTHALLYLAEQAKKIGAIPVYVDLRYIGSSGGLYANTTIPIPQRATRLLLDVLGSIHEFLFAYAVDAAMDLAAVGPALDGLASSVTEVEVVGDIQVESKQVEGNEQQDSTEIKFALQGRPAVEFSSASGSKTSSQSETKVAKSGTPRYRVHFGSTSNALAELVKAVKPARLIFILDEWSAIPLDLQPYLAGSHQASRLPSTRYHGEDCRDRTTVQLQDGKPFRLHRN